MYVIGYFTFVRLCVGFENIKILIFVGSFFFFCLSLFIAQIFRGSTFWQNLQRNKWMGTVGKLTSCWQIETLTPPHPTPSPRVEKKSPSDTPGHMLDFRLLSIDRITIIGRSKGLYKRTKDGFAQFCFKWMGWLWYDLSYLLIFLCHTPKSTLM